MRRLTTWDWVSMVLLVVGGLNWGLVGLFEFDLVAALFGEMSWFTRLVYVLVGVSAVYMIAVSPRLRHPEPGGRPAPT